MLNFVEAEGDALRGDHSGGNVSADAEAVLVSLVDDSGHERRRYRTVNLDLDIAQPLVVVDGGTGFGFGGD